MKPGPTNRIRVLFATCACLLAAACASPPPPPQASPVVAPDRLASLERTFWACDYIGTTRGVLHAPEECRSVVTRLKVHKFRGDFEALLVWWRTNKPEEHRRLAVEACF